MVNIIIFGLKFVFLFLFYILLVAIARGIFKDTEVKVEKTETTVKPAQLQLLSAQGNIVAEVDVIKEAIIGRSDKADILIDDDFASYTHAKVFRDGHSYFLKDLKSTNGTFLNSAKINKARLNDGDVIAIGKTRIKFVK